MSISTLHRLDKLVLPSSVIFNALSNLRLSAGIESMIEHPAGHVDPMFVATMRQRPTIEFSTPELSVLLAAVGVGGASLGASTAYLKAASTTGSVARATTGHKRVVVNSSIAYWTQIRLPHNGKAEAQVVLAANYDGTNAPFVYTGSVALAGNLTASKYFGAGPLAVNGTQVPGIQEITISSGVQLVQEGDASEVWDTFTGIEMTSPSVTVQTKEAINWSTIGLQGLALDGTDGLQFYARAFQNLSDRYSNASTEHIFFEGLLGRGIPQDTNGESNSPITDTIKFELVSSTDSLRPLVVTTGVAITAF